MTPDVLAFLRDLLCRQTIQVGAADYKQTVAIVGRALDEIDTAITTAEPSPADTTT